MIRLSDLQSGQAGSVVLPYDPRTRDAFSLIQGARAFRSHFFTLRLRRAFAALSRWSGLPELLATLSRRARKRRTLRALAELDDRLLRDIGVARADIEATAAFCCTDMPAAGNSVWYGLTAWAERETRRRRTERELSALSDAMLADIGIERTEIPAIAAAVADPRRGPEARHAEDSLPQSEGVDRRLSAQIIAFSELRRSLRRGLEQDHDRSTAA